MLLFAYAIIIGSIGTISWILCSVIVITPIMFFLFFLKPIIGIIIVTFMIPIEFFVARGPGNSLIQLVGSLTFIAGSAYLLIYHKPNIKYPWIAIIFVSLTWLASLCQGVFDFKLITYLMLLAFYWLLTNFVTEDRSIRWVLWALIGGTVISIPLSFLFGTDRIAWIAGKQIVRFSGGISDPNDYAGILIVAFAALIGFTSSRDKKFFITLFYVILAIPIFIAIIMTYSRGGILALAVVILVWIWSTRFNLKVRILLAIVTFLFWQIMLLLPGMNERLISIYSLSDRGAGRLDIWISALTHVLPISPIVGVGTGRFVTALQTYTPYGYHAAHNMFLNVAIESGLIALIVFLCLVLRPYFKLLRQFKTLQTYPGYDVVVAVLLGITGALVAGQFLTWDHQKILWLMVALSDKICSIYLNDAKLTNEL